MPASDEDEASEASATAKRCASCNAELVHRGERRLRHGGPEGWTLFREWRELDEKLWTVHVWACPSCQRLELYEDA